VVKFYNDGVVQAVTFAYLLTSFLLKAVLTVNISVDDFMSLSSTVLK